MTYTIYNVVGYVLLALDKCKQEYKSKKMVLRLPQRGAIQYVVYMTKLYSRR